MLLAEAAASGVTYATINPSDKDANVTLSGGDLTASTAVANNCPYRATIGKSSGKWYWEVTGANNIGISTTALPMTTGNYPGLTTTSFSYNRTGVKYNNNIPTAYGATFTSSDVIGVALDMTTGALEFYKNGVSQGVAFTGISGTLYPTDTVFSGTNSPSTSNFGASAFPFGVPSGYNAGLY